MYGIGYKGMSLNACECKHLLLPTVKYSNDKW